MSARSISTAFAVFVVLGAAGWLMATMARTDRADRYLISIAGVLIGGLIIALAVGTSGGVVAMGALAASDRRVLL